MKSRRLNPFLRGCFVVAVALVLAFWIGSSTAVDAQTPPQFGQPMTPGAGNQSLLSNGTGAGVADPYQSGCAGYSGVGGVFSSLNPIAAACNQSFAWIAAGKNAAFGLLVGLLTLEFFILGVRFGLFKSDPSELIGSLSFKVMVSCLMIWVINNADGMFQSIVRGFESAGQQISGANVGSAFSLSATYALAGLALMAVAGAAHSADAVTPNFPADQPMAGGTALLLTGTGLGSAHLHDIEYQMLTLCSYVMLACAAVVVLQYILITVESYIVILGGIVMLGFAGSSFTLPFARGYMSYAINNGVRIFVFYLVIAIENGLVGSNLQSAFFSAAISIAASVFPGGIAIADATTITVAISVMQIAVTTSLVWFIPNLAGSMLGQNSGLTAGTMLSQIQSTMKTAGDSLHGLSSSMQRHNHSQQSGGAPLQSGAPGAPSHGGGTTGGGGAVMSGDTSGASMAPASGGGALGSSTLPAASGAPGAGGPGASGSGAAAAGSPLSTVTGFGSGGGSGQSSGSSESGESSGGPAARPDASVAQSVTASQSPVAPSAIGTAASRPATGQAGEGDSGGVDGGSQSNSGDGGGDGANSAAPAPIANSKKRRLTRHASNAALTSVNLATPQAAAQLSTLSTATRIQMIEAIDAKLDGMSQQSANDNMFQAFAQPPSGQSSSTGAPSAVQIRFKLDDAAAFDPTSE